MGRMTSVRRALVLAVFLAGCGSDGGGSGGGGAPPGPAPVVLASVEVSPTSPEIRRGESVILEATGVYSDGRRETLTSPIWGTSDASIASVDASGLVSGIRWGNVVISAGAAGAPGVIGTANVRVRDTVVLGIDQDDGLVEYSSDGPARRVLTMTVPFGPRNLGGLAVSGDRIYVLNSQAGSTPSQVWSIDPETGEGSLVAGFTGTTRYCTLATDPAGDIFCANIADNTIYKTSPGRDPVLFADLPSWMGLALETDEEGSLYVQLLDPDPNWVYRVSPRGTFEPVLYTPGGRFPSAGGMAILSPTLMYAADSFNGVVYRAEDLNADGDFLDAGERVACTPPTIQVWGILWDAASNRLLVNDTGSRRITACTDKDGDGLFLTDGEQETWSDEPVLSGNTFSLWRTYER